MRISVREWEGGEPARAGHLERGRETETERAAPAAELERRGPMRRHWSLDDIPWHEIRHDRVENSEALFYMIAAASLMESATDLYTEKSDRLLCGRRRDYLLAERSLAA